jgi:hypothetical protein
MTLRLTAGDTAPTLTGTINAATVGASAVVHIRRSDATVISRTATSLTDNADGTSSWTLDLADTDLTVPGEYGVEVKVTFSNGKAQTFHYGTDNQPTEFFTRAAYEAADA